MRLVAPYLYTVAIGLLAGCAITAFDQVPLRPRHSTRMPALSPILKCPTRPRAAFMPAVFATSILAYKSSNKKNGAPTCNIPGVQYLNGVAVDGKGNVIDPDGGSRRSLFSRPVARS